MKVYGLFINDYVEGAALAVNLLKLYTNENTALLEAAKLNAKYPELPEDADFKDKYARDDSIWEEIESGEYNLKDMAGCLENEFEDFYVKELNVSES